MLILSQLNQLVQGYLFLRVCVLAELFVWAVCAPLAREDLGAQLVPAVGEVAAVAEGAARHVVEPVSA